MNAPPLEKWQAYLRSHASTPAALKTPPRAVTLSRETGAGAAEIARLLSAYLEKNEPVPAPWAVFDRQLVRQVLRDHDLPETLEPYLPEDSPAATRDVIEELLGLHPSSWTLVEHTSHTILRLAGAGHVILIGRGAHLVTAGLRHVLHVRLIAPLDFRIRHIQRSLRLSPVAAAEHIRRSDAARARYIRRNFDARVNDPLRFHLTINTGRVTFETAARLIGDTVLQLPSG